MEKGSNMKEFLLGIKNLLIQIGVDLINDEDVVLIILNTLPSKQ
jgi:hypothetical protein